MTEQELTTMQKVAKGILLVVGAPFLMIGVLMAIYVAMFTSIVRPIRNRSKVRQSAPQPVKDEIAEAAMEPVLESWAVPHMVR